LNSALVPVQDGGDVTVRQDLIGLRLVLARPCPPNRRGRPSRRWGARARWRERGPEAA